MGQMIGHSVELNNSMDERDTSICVSYLLCEYVMYTVGDQQYTNRCTTDTI